MMLGDLATNRCRARGRGPTLKNLESSRQFSLTAFGWQDPALLHRRKIRRTHVRHVYFFHRFVGLLGFEHLLKFWVCTERIPVLFRFLSAGMSHHKDECIVPSG